MRWKTTLILFAATVGLGAYLGLYEFKQPTLEERQRLDTQILDIPSSTISRMVFEMPKGKFTLVRQDVWRFQENGIRADEGLLERFLDQLSPLTAARTLKGSVDEPFDLSSFGLQPAQGQVNLDSKDGGTMLRFGSETPVGQNRYLQIDARSEIFVVSNHLFESADQPIDMWRDPLLIRFDRWLLDGLTVSGSSSTFSLARTDNRWSLSQPFQDHADSAQVESLLTELSKIAIQRYPDALTQKPSQQEQILPSLQATIMISQRDPGKPLTLVFGEALPDEPSLIFVTRSDEPLRYAVSANILQNLLPTPETLRSKTCLEFLAHEALKFELSWEGKTWTVERVEEEWQDATTHEKLDTKSVETLLGDLANLRFSDLVQDQEPDLRSYGLQNPQGSLVVWTGTEPHSVQRLLVGSETENPKTRYGWLEQRHLIVQIPLEPLLHLLNTSIETFRTPEPSATDTSPE